MRQLKRYACDALAGCSVKTQHLKEIYKLNNFQPLSENFYNIYSNIYMYESFIMILKNLFDLHP